VGTIFIPGTAGDLDIVYEGRASGGIIINSDKVVIVDPGIGFAVKSMLKKADIILLSSKELIYSNDAAAIEKRFGAKIEEKDSAHIKKFQNSLRIETQKYVLGYISSPKISKTFAEEFKDSNILVLRCESSSMHDMINMIEYINPELAVLTGFTKGMDPLEITRSLRKEMQKYKVKTQIIAAKDQMTINPESYNIKLKQKSLKGFLG
jgi:hypothetical protein